MTAEQKALQDIQEYCSENSKVFIQFIPELNPVMDELVANYLRIQEERK